MAKELKIGFVLVVFFLGLLFFFFPKRTTSNKTVDVKISPTPSVELTTVPKKVVVVEKTPSASPTQQTDSNTYALDEVARHNTTKDCWIIIDGFVYKVTDYLKIHPGGADRIIPFCGDDATAAFKEVSKHNGRADADLARLLIGKLK